MWCSENAALTLKRLIAYDVDLFFVLGSSNSFDTGSPLAWFGALLTGADVGGAHDGRAGGPEQLAIFVHHLGQAGQAHLYPQADEHDR